LQTDWVASQVEGLPLEILLHDHDQGRQKEVMARSSMAAAVVAAVALVAAGSTAQPLTPTPSTTLRHPHDPDLPGKNPLYSATPRTQQGSGLPTPDHQQCPNAPPQPKTPSEPSSATPHHPALALRHPPFPFPPQERNTVPVQPPQPHPYSAAAGMYQNPVLTVTPSVLVLSPPAALARRRGRFPLCLAPARDPRGSSEARRGGPGWVVVGRM